MTLQRDSLDPPPGEDLSETEILNKLLFEAKKDREHLADQLVQQCTAGIGVLSRIKLKAERVRSGKPEWWSSLGEEQGNAAIHVDTIVGRLHELDQMIKRIEGANGD